MKSDAREPRKRGPTPAPIEARFFGHVEATEGCWWWTAYRYPGGYGLFHPTRSSNAYAHRWIYERFVGPLSPELEIDHLCGNRSCVNPFHLEQVTRRENNVRSLSPTARNARKIACIRNHPFTPENTRIDSRGRRRCRTCEHERIRSRT